LPAGLAAYVQHDLTRARVVDVEDRSSRCDGALKQAHGLAALAPINRAFDYSAFGQPDHERQLEHATPPTPHTTTRRTYPDP